MKLAGLILVILLQGCVGRPVIKSGPTDSQLLILDYMDKHCVFQPVQGQFGEGSFYYELHCFVLPKSRTAQ